MAKAQKKMVGAGGRKEDAAKAKEKAAKQARRKLAAEAIKELKLPASVVFPLPDAVGGGSFTATPLASKKGSVGYFGNGKFVLGDQELTFTFQSWVKHSQDMELGL